MLEVESVTQVKKSRRKHDRSQSANIPVKDMHAEYIEDYNLKTNSKTSKHLKETQDKLAKLEIAEDFNKGQSDENIEKTKKKKRRRRPHSADQLNDDTASIRKDPTLAEQNLIQANLYKNDKNKSLEKETKQSYSEALSGWSQDEITDDHQYKSKKTENEQKDRRVRKKTNLDHKEVAAAVETAVNVEKVRKRIKKRTKQRETTHDPVDHRDAIDGHEGTQKESRNNLGYESGEREDTVEHTEGGKTKSKSKARENLGYEDERETKETSREPKPEKLKSGKRRRKKLKEASADVIHRALEKKRQDDGHVMCIVIHKADRLKTDLRINHPLVRVHVVDVNTGEYVKKCSRNRAATSYYENQETVDHILPLMTQPFDFKQRKSLIPSWEDVLIINEIYSYFLQRNEGDPNVIIFFEILDFLSMTAINKLKGTQRSDRGWYQIAWAFLKLVGSNGSPNTDTKIRLQLFYPVKSNRRRQLLNPNIPEVYHWWSSPSRLPYPSTLYVTVKGIKPPKDIDAAGRSMFAVQEERGKMTFEELTGKIGRGESPSELDPNHDIVTWTKLPGQPNHVPNQIMSTLQAGRRGCFVVRFSNDGRKLACGCAEKHSFSIFIFETLSGRNISKFQGHFSIIYDLCWSHNDKELLSASSDGTARSWEVSRDGSSATKTYPHPCFVYAARYHPQRKNIVITGGYDRLVRIWRNDSEGVNGQLLREMDGHSGFINTICFDLAGQYMFSGDSSGTVIVWNTYESIETKSGKRRTKSAADVQRWVISKTAQDPEIKDCIINSIQLHPNGRKLLVHTRDSVTRMLDLRSFSMMTRYIGANNFREHVRSTMTTCGSFVFSGSEDGLVYVWDTETGNAVKVYNELGYTSAVSDIDFHPHDNIVAFCSFGQNHPVILYQFNRSGTVDETPYTASSPPMSPLRTTTRTLGQTTEQLLTTEPRTAERTMHMADVASETLLLNKIRKKLDSVLEVSNTTAGLQSSMAGSRTFQRTPSPNSLLPDTLFEQRDLRTLSTWGSDFSTLPTTPYSPGSHPQSPQRGFGTQTLSQFETGHLGGSHFLSPSQEQLTYSRPQSRRDTVALFMVKAAYPFAARNADELNLDEGDVLKVLRQEDEHWWVGEMEDGRQGYFPASYTVMIEQTKKKKVEKHAEKKQYTAVKTAEGDVKILSAPEESDVDVVVKKRSRVDGRTPRHTRDKSRPSSTIGKKSPRRTKNVRDESNA